MTCIVPVRIVSKTKKQQFPRINVDPCLVIHVVVSLSSRSVFLFILFPFFAHLVLTCVPLIAIRFNTAIALFARAPRFEASGERGKSHGRSGIRRFDELDTVLDHAQPGEGACCNCRVLNLVSTRLAYFVFPSVPCSFAVAMVFHVGDNWTHSFLLRKLECFTHVLWRIQVSRWYVLRTMQNGDFVLLPFGVSRLVGAVALGWRSGARARYCFLPLFSPCVVHVRTSVDVHLDPCDRTQAVSFNHCTIFNRVMSPTFVCVDVGY